MKTVETVWIIRSAFKNWLGIGLNLKFSKKNRLKVVLRTGELYELWKNYFWAIIPLLKKGIQANKIIENLLNDRIPYNNGFVIVHGWIGEDNRNNGNIFDVFIKEEYRFLNVKDRTVIDVGASIGDSPIYFAVNGATKVIGLEPYPYTFKFGVRNIQENGLDEKIIFLNAGYGLDGEILLDENKVSTDAMEALPSKIGKKIPIYSLKSLVNKFNLDKAVLKMDCEGCEYSLVNEDKDVLDRFSQMQIEYHYGPEKLVEKLRNCGFDVKYSEPKKYIDPGAIKPKMLGYIYATKVD